MAEVGLDPTSPWSPMAPPKAGKLAASRSDKKMLPKGLEPSPRERHGPKPCASANSATGAKNLTGGTWMPCFTTRPAGRWKISDCPALGETIIIDNYH